MAEIDMLSSTKLSITSNKVSSVISNSNSEIKSVIDVKTPAFISPNIVPIPNPNPNTNLIAFPVNQDVKNKVDLDPKGLSKSPKRVAIFTMDSFPSYEADSRKGIKLYEQVYIIVIIIVI